MSTGNPHFVVFVDRPNFYDYPWESIGEEICSHRANFPLQQTNDVEFVRMINGDEIEIRIYERGVGPTSSSGTGTCASASAAIALRGASPRLAAWSLHAGRATNHRMARTRFTGDSLDRAGGAYLFRRGMVKLEPANGVFLQCAGGAKVTVLSPASYPQPERLATGVEALSRLGFLPWVGHHALSKAHHYFAGTTGARLEDLHAAFLDPAAGAIFCSRGGYGCNYLLGGPSTWVAWCAGES